ncbi:MAG: DUF5681 domain-containing protein [Gammaproteobacteria bacterium]|nr:DUF5681 domain-containing protein [Gammaproteobacteria bacterium]
MTFKPGESGNPNGRPSGSQNKRTLLIKLLEPYAEELITKLVELARGGDVNALRLCIERLVPKATHESVNLSFNTAEINNIQYLMDFGREILAAVASGEITPEVAKTLSGVADTHRRLIENGELRLKLEEIERAIKQHR